MMQNKFAGNDEEFQIHSHGQDWLTSWSPAATVPDGKPHGAAGICITDDGNIVLISANGADWDFPAGRPEGDETWEETLRREMIEEACATVVDARLLGFSRGVCVGGSETGLILVRSFWRAQVRLGAWTPQFEIAHRRIVLPQEVEFHLPRAYLPLFRRALYEAAVL